MVIGVHVHDLTEVIKVFAAVNRLQFNHRCEPCGYHPGEHIGHVRIVDQAAVAGIADAVVDWPPMAKKSK